MLALLAFPTSVGSVRGEEQDDATDSGKVVVAHVSLHSLAEESVTEKEHLQPSAVDIQKIEHMKQTSNTSTENNATSASSRRKHKSADLRNFAESVVAGEKRPKMNA